MSTEQEKILAVALYEIRVLLSGYLGSDNSAPLSVRIAAHLAYALHNEAEAVMGNRSFSLEAAIAKVNAIDNILGTEDGARLSRIMLNGEA